MGHVGNIGVKEMPLIFPFSIADWMNISNTLAMIMYKKGERGPPYLIPLDGLKVEEGFPLIKV